MIQNEFDDMRWAESMLALEADDGYSKLEFKNNEPAFGRMIFNQRFQQVWKLHESHLESQNEDELNLLETHYCGQSTDLNTQREALKQQQKIRDDDHRQKFKYLMEQR